MDQTALRTIGRVFGKDCDFSPIGEGHINDTYRSSDGKWILQRINTNVFTKPDEVMENIAAVTDWIRAKNERKEQADGWTTLKIVPASDNALLYRDGSGCWRMYENIAHAHSVEPEDCSRAEFMRAAAAFGRFQRDLEGFPAEKLHETIPDFHNTEKRLAKLKAVVQSLKEKESETLLEKEPAQESRLQRAMPHVEFVLSQEPLASIVLNGIRDGSIPLAVTHNDT
ncbi:MAG: hypothetical protein IKR59_01390, partial [Lachnospiraceae bacterium]|nr:hypothetical protein [Lachnospiraceae bacterium]